MKALIDERFSVTPFYVFFLIYASQMGVVGITTFQREIINSAGYDAWISVLLCGLSIHVLLWMVYRILRIADHDVMYVHQYCFGKWIGGLFNFLIILYYLWASVIILRSYIEIVQVWMFPLMKTWILSVVFLILIYYIVSSGFRVIAGVCFFGAVIPFFILFPLVFFSLEFAHINHLFPLFNHSAKEVLISSKTMTFQFLGLETLFMFYPFIKEPEKSQKWAHFAVLFSVFIYLTVTFITFSFFSEGYLKHLIWPTLNLLKIAQLPILERTEYFVVSIYFLVFLPNISLRLWAACRGLKKLIHIKQRFILLMILFLIFIFSISLEEHIEIKQLSDLYSNIGFYFIYIYIPFLFFYIHIKYKLMKQK